MPRDELFYCTFCFHKFISLWNNLISSFLDSWSSWLMDGFRLSAGKCAIPTKTENCNTINIAFFAQNFDVIVHWWIYLSWLYLYIPISVDSFNKSAPKIIFWLLFSTKLYCWVTNCTYTPMLVWCTRPFSQFVHSSFWPNNCIIVLIARTVCDLWEEIYRPAL